MTCEALGMNAAMRALAAVAVCVGCSWAALAFEPMQDWSGRTANEPSQGALEIMREAERGPSVTRRLELPQLSGPLPLELSVDGVFSRRNPSAALLSPPEYAQAPFRR